jgi:hypothetical protein
MAHKRRFLLWVLIAVGSFAFSIVLFASVFDANMRQNRNEVLAVRKLQSLAELQHNYTVSHPAKGFACRLPLLKPDVPDTNSNDADEFVVSGTLSGYQFAITGCQEDPDGIVRKYQITAVPLEQSETGFRAFCTDQAASIRYDMEGSVARCLASGRPLQ